MNERDKILGRIREALRVPARSHTAAHHPAEPTGETYAKVLPEIGPSFEERLIAFQTESLDLRTEFRLLNAEPEMAAALQKLHRREGWQQIASHRGQLTEAWVPGLELPTHWVDDGVEGRALETCDVGITECDCLVAQTGTVVVTTRSAGGRALSVLPPHHVVLARREQLLGGLPEAFELLETRYGPTYPSMMSFITGPSRTGDIERILVLGAHGPKKLTILCL